MAYRIRRVEYFHATVVDEPGEAYKVLSALAGLGVNLVAFTAVPVGPDRTQLTALPGGPGEDEERGAEGGDGARRAAPRAPRAGRRRARRARGACTRRSTARA